MELSENLKLSRSRNRESMHNVTGKLGRRNDDELKPEYKHKLETIFTMNKAFLLKGALRPFFVICYSLMMLERNKVKNEKEKNT